MTESPFQKAYEFEKKYDIGRLKLCIEKAKNAYKTHEPETIGCCKNILESICTSVLEEKMKHDKENIQNLVGKTLGLFNINSQISGGLTNVIGGVLRLPKVLGK